MIKPRWRKVWKDLGANKGRTVLVMLTIAVGVFAVGFVSTSFVLILNDMDADYQSANPHAAIIYTEPFDDDFVEALARVPGVGQVEGRSAVSGRVLLPDGKKFTITVTAVPAFETIRIDRIRPENPATLPALADKEIFIERAAQAGLGVEPGDMIQIELSDGDVRQVRVAGIVHDVTSLPFTFTQQVSAYTHPDTVYWLGGPRQYNQAYITVAENKRDEEHVEFVAAQVAKKIEDSGRETFFTFIFQPGRHFATDITQALGVMMGFLGGLAVFLSAFLVVNTVNALLGQQVRQIGVMKAVGARSFQLVGMYLVLVLSFGVLALLIAAPAAIYLSYMGVAGIGEYLNFNPGPFRIPPVTLALQSMVALVVPVVATMVPVVRGTRLTIREAITSYGLGRGSYGRSLIDRVVEKIRRLPRPLLISLRNTFRRKGRLLLTLSTLTLAGAIFIAVFNLRAAMSVAINQTLGYILSDVNVSFSQSYHLDKIRPIADSVPGVVGIEGWATTLGEMLSADGSTANQVLMLAPPAESSLIDPTLTSGRWLLPEDQNGIVIGNHLLAVRPELKVGDEVTVQLNGKKNTWVIVGTFQMAGNVVPPIVYANYEYLTRILGTINRTSEVRITTNQHDLLTQKRIGNQLEILFKQAGIKVASVSTGAELVSQNTSQTDVLVYFLLVMAVLIALVGGLGLMSTMSMNVIERTREIGVMRAIGASNRAIHQLVIVEGMLIGLISWVLGGMLAIPIGMVLSNVVGVAFLQSPLDFVLSADGFVVWLAGVLLLSAIASAIPARSASRLTVREVLAYE